ncbi:MAG: AsmA family protein [Nitrospina sp.]|nr:MAG: AsmA family protein [Nitrospina sp.]
MDVPNKKRKIPPRKSSPVKNRKPRILIILAAGLAGILIIIMAVVFSVDPNNFREPVIHVLTRATGLNINIESLDWSFSRGLQFKCKGLQIYSADQEKELLSTDELLLKLKLLPLLQQKIVIDSITLIRPVLKISVKPGAGPNTLAKINTLDSDPTPSLPVQKINSFPEWLRVLRDFLKNPNLTLAEINLIAGQVIFQDESTGKEIPLDIGVQMRIVREENQIELILDDLEFGTGNLVAVGEIRANDLLSSNSVLQATLNFKPFKATDILPVLDWVPQARNILNEEMRLKGNFDSLSLRLETPVETLTDFESVSRSATLDLVLKITEITLVHSGQPLSFPTFEVAAQWKNQQLIHKINWSVFSGDFVVEGKIFREDPLGPVFKGTLDSHLTFENVDFHELKNISPEPMPWFPEAGVIGGTVHVRGPVMRPEALRVNGKFKIPETAIRVRGTRVALSDIDGQGKWHDGHLTHEIGMKVFGGQVRVQGNLDLKNDGKGDWDPVIDSNVTIQSISLPDIKPLVQKEWFPEKGLLTGTVRLKGPVKHPEAMEGSGNLNFSDLEIETKTGSVRFPLVEAEGTWSNKKLVHNIRANVFDGNIQVKGQLELGKANQDPIIDSDVVIDSVQLARLKPMVAQDWFPETGSLSGKVHLKGSVTRPKALQAKGQIRVQKTTVSIQGQKVHFAIIDGAGQWSGSHLKHDVRMSVLGGEIRIKGDINLKKDPKGAWDPVINSDVISKSVQLADLRPLVAQDWFPEAGVIGGTVHIRGPVMRPDALRIKGNFSVPETAIQIQGTPVALSDIAVQGRWHNGRLTHKVSAKIFGGEIRVQGTLDPHKDEQGNWAPVIDSDVITKSLHFAKLRPLIQVDSFPESGEFTSNIRLDGPVMHPEALHVKGDFQVQKVVIPIHGKQMAVPYIDFQGEWQDGRLAHQVKAHVFGGEIQVKGNLDLKKDAQGVWEPVIDSHLIIRSIHFPKIKPLIQKDWFPKKGQLTGTVHLRGPAKSFRELNISGKFSGEKIALNFDKTQVVIKETLVSFKPKGNEGFFMNLDMSQIKINEIALKNVMARTFVSKISFELKRGKILPKNGTLLLKGNYNLKTTSYKLDILGKDLRLENFIEDHIQGPLRFRGSFFGDLSSDDFLRGLSGKLNIKSEKGHVLKVGQVASTIIRAMNFKLPTNSKDGMLPYDYMGGSCIIKNGVLSTKGFDLMSPSIKVKVYGDTNLSKRTLHAEVRVRPLQSIAKAIDALKSIVDTSLSSIKADGTVGSKIPEIPLIGDVLPENGIGNALGETPVVGGLVRSILKKIPIVRNLVGGNEENQQFIHIYFSVEGTYEEPKVSFLPGKLFSTTLNTD